MSINLLGKGYVADGNVADWELTEHPDWTIEIETRNEWYTWNESFIATHITLGIVIGTVKALYLLILQVQLMSY
jgi:hypothetical protein